MPPFVAIVVSCGVRYSARTGKFHVKLTRQEGHGAGTQYVKYEAYVDTWADAVAWFGTY